MVHPAPIDLGRTVLRFEGPPLIMGILNTTPDSFSDGGRHLDPSRAIEAGLAMIEQGADILDIGGESTRPGADPVGEGEELARVLPVIEGIRRHEGRIAISIDTTKAAVAAAALDAGADILNDVSGMRREAEMAGVVASRGAAAVLMHMRGTPRTMQADTLYDDLVDEVGAHLRALVGSAVSAGVNEGKLIVDPGIGFGKDVGGNLSLIKHTRRFSVEGRPVLIGPSRKSFIGHLLAIDDPRLREWGTAGAVAAAVFCGAHILRVHEVGPMWQASRIAHAVSASG